jgi:hypothetical protein
VDGLDWANIGCIVTTSRQTTRVIINGKLGKYLCVCILSTLLKFFGVNVM